MKRFIQYLAQIVIFGGLIGLCILHYTGNQTPPEIDPRLEQYAQEWRSDMDSSGVTYNWNVLDYIKLVDNVPGGLLNLTDPFSAGASDQSTRTVYIRDAEKYKPIHIKVILYHELGHYVFNAKHQLGEGGIMSESLIEDHSYYEQKWDSLLIEYINQVDNGR